MQNFGMIKYLASNGHKNALIWLQTVVARCRFFLWLPYRFSTHDFLTAFQNTTSMQTFAGLESLSVGMNIAHVIVAAFVKVAVHKKHQIPYCASAL